MNEYLFLTGPGHLPESANKIAQKHGATLVNYTDPGTGEKRHWFAGPNRGNPFDRQLSEAVAADLGVEMEVITLDRTGLPPIRFTGVVVGATTIETGAGRRTRVKIFRSKGGKWLAQVGHLTQWQGEHSSYSAASAETPAALIAWLTNDCDGHLGRASQEACEDAARNDAAFAKAFVEEVE